MSNNKMSLNTVKILGVTVVSTPEAEVLERVVRFLAGPRLTTPLLIFTPNPEFLVEAQKDLSFKELLNKADINLPDGIGLVWASRFLGAPIKERISGAEVVRELLEIGNKGERWEVGIAGARREVREETNELVKRLRERYPQIEFVNLDCEDKKLKIKNLKLKIVFACQGMKKQEEWIWENKDKIKANVFMGIGGSLDFIAGFTKRAPRWIQEVGFEWLWRGLQRPSHFKRIRKAVFVFGWLVVREKLNAT